MWENSKKGRCSSRHNKQIMIIIWAVSHVRYKGLFLKWNREELKQMDPRTRKLMMRHETLHPRDDIDRLYESRKEGWRGPASIEDSVDALIQWLKDYIEKRGGRLITATRKDTWQHED